MHTALCRSPITDPRPPPAGALAPTLSPTLHPPPPALTSAVLKTSLGSFPVSRFLAMGIRPIRHFSSLRLALPTWVSPRRLPPSLAGPPDCPPGHTPPVPPSHVRSRAPPAQTPSQGLHNSGYSRLLFVGCFPVKQLPFLNSNVFRQDRDSVFVLDFFFFSLCPTGVTSHQVHHKKKKKNT